MVKSYLQSLEGISIKGVELPKFCCVSQEPLVSLTTKSPELIVGMRIEEFVIL